MENNLFISSVLKNVIIDMHKTKVSANTFSKNSSEDLVKYFKEVLKISQGEKCLNTPQSCGNKEQVFWPTKFCQQKLKKKKRVK